MSWTWKSDIPVGCMITSPRVELLIGSESRVHKDVDTTNNSTDFLTQLNCNEVYKAKVTVTVAGTQQSFDGLRSLTYGGGRYM